MASFTRRLPEQAKLASRIKAWRNWFWTWQQATASPLGDISKSTNSAGQLHPSQFVPPTHLLEHSKGKCNIETSLMGAAGRAVECYESFLPAMHAVTPQPIACLIPTAQHAAPRNCKYLYGS